MYLSIIFLPLVGSVLSGLFGRFLSPKGAALVSILGMSLACLVSVILFFEVGYVWFDQIFTVFVSRWQCFFYTSCVPHFR